MPYHNWSEKDFDWDSLDKAVNIIESTCRKWGRFGCDAKEKFGCIRAYVNFYNGGFHELIYPGYHYCQWPKWLWILDRQYFTIATKYTGLNWVITKYQHKIYNLAYQRALKAALLLRDEILSDADHPELIKGGQEVHDKFWTKVTPTPTDSKDNKPE